VGHGAVSGRPRRSRSCVVHRQSPRVPSAARRAPNAGGDHAGSDSKGNLGYTKSPHAMPSLTVLVTGSCGLIGSEVSIFLARNGFRVVGIDNNHRAFFFGPEGDTSWVLQHLRKQIASYRHLDLDIR